MKVNSGKNNFSNVFSKLATNRCSTITDVNDYADYNYSWRFSGNEYSSIGPMAFTQMQKFSRYRQCGTSVKV